MKTEIETTQQRAQTVEAELAKVQRALTAEQATREKVAKERDQLQQLVSELRAKLPLEPLYENDIGMQFVLIPTGTFEMGSDHGDDEKPAREVTISKPFYLGQHEVTQEQWTKVMGDNNNPSETKGNELPVTHVSWRDVQNFIETLNTREGADVYRLPTEAEWEYAARAGMPTAYSFGDDPTQLRHYGWYSGNSEEHIQPVKQKAANPWELYDMHGNVWEWVQDCWHKNYDRAPRDGSAWQNETCKRRVARGGAHYSSPPALRSAQRNRFYPEDKYSYLGFRCVRIPQP